MGWGFLSSVEGLASAREWSWLLEKISPVSEVDEGSVVGVTYASVLLLLPISSRSPEMLLFFRSDHWPFFSSVGIGLCPRCFSLRPLFWPNGSFLALF